MKTSQSEEDRSVYSRTEATAVLVVVIAVTTALIFAGAPLNQVADPVRKSFGISDLQFSYILGTFAAVPSVIMTVAGGWLADRISRRWLLATAMLLWTCGGVGCALAATYTQLVIARIVFAAASGIQFPLVMTWVSDAYSQERRGKAIGAVFVVLGIAPGIGAFLSGLVLHASRHGTFAAIPLLGSLEPWRFTVLLLASSNLCVLPWIFALRDARRGSEGKSGEPQTTATEESHSLWLIALVMLSSALLTLGDNANLGWLPTVLSREHGFDAREVGSAFGMIVIVAGSLGPLLGGMLDGWAYRRYRTTGRLVACSVAAFLCAPLLASYFGRSAHLLVGALTINGILTMLTMTVNFVAMQSLLPLRQQGLGVGISQALTNLGAASAPTIVAFASAALPVSAYTLGRGVATVTISAFLATTGCCCISAIALAHREHRVPGRRDFTTCGMRS